MKPMRLVPMGTTDRGLLAAVAPYLRATIATNTIDIAFAHHPERNQYHSTQLLEHLPRYSARGELIVGVTGHDLYIPILTFVFGEAHVGGTCAVVSYHRLTQEFYGLPPDRQLLIDRLVKEIIHEAGHTAGLHHCDDYECVMAPSHAVEWVDMKGGAFCDRCISQQRTAAKFISA